MSFDLATLNASTACEAEHELELLHPVTNEPLGLFITHKGVNSPEVQAVINRQGNEILNKQFRAQRKGKDEDAPTVEEGRRRNAKLMAAASVRWFERDAKGKETDGFPFGPDRKVFSQDAALELYADPGFAWLVGQLEEAVSDLGNFMPT